MRKFSFYHLETGEFHMGVFGTDDPRESVVAANTPKGHAAIEGEFDHLSQRMDVASGKVVQRQSPRESSRRAAESLRATRAKIASLEARQARAVREAVLGKPGALDRLRDIDDQISAARSGL